MNITYKCLLALAAGALLSQSAFADTIAFPNTIAFFDQNQVIEDLSSPRFTSPPPFAHDPNVIVSALTAHGTAAQQTGGNPITYNKWATTINTTNYVGFTVTPNNGNQLSLMGLSFADTYVGDTQDGSSYQWAYRIDEGAGFGDWVIATAYAPTSGAFWNKVWTFPAPIVTKGTVEFGYFGATASTSTYLSPGSPFLSGTAGDHPVDPTLGTGVISSYTDASTYSLQNSEASGLTYDWDAKTLKSVGDEGASIVETNKTGTILSTMSMQELKFSGGIKGDPEGLSYKGKDGNGLGSYLIAAERENSAYALDYMPNGANIPAWMTTPAIVNFGAVSANIGLEGVSYDVTDGTIWGIKERQAVSVFHATNIGTSSQSVAAIDMNDINWRIGVNSLSDIYVMANSAAYANSDHVLVLARDDNKIIEITRDGKVVDVLDISPIGRGSIEGMTMDDDGVIYLCSEQGGALAGFNVNKTNFPGLHVLTKAKHPVTGTGGRQTLVGTAGDDEIYGNQAADTLTGGAGKDVFVFKSLRDGIDTITDFTPGQDAIDISAVLDSVGYVGSVFTNPSYTPLTDGEVRVIDSPTGAVLQILSAGSYRSLAVLSGLTAAQVTLTPDNFHYMTAKLKPSTSYENGTTPVVTPAITTATR